MKGCFNVKIMVGFHLLVFSKYTLFFSLRQHLKKNIFIKSQRVTVFGGTGAASHHRCHPNARQRGARSRAQTPPQMPQTVGMPHVASEIPPSLPASKTLGGSKTRLRAKDHASASEMHAAWSQTSRAASASKRNFKCRARNKVPLRGTCNEVIDRTKRRTSSRLLAWSYEQIASTRHHASSTQLHAAACP